MGSVGTAKGSRAMTISESASPRMSIPSQKLDVPKMTARGLSVRLSVSLRGRAVSPLHHHADALPFEFVARERGYPPQRGVGGEQRQRAPFRGADELHDRGRRGLVVARARWARVYPSAWPGGSNAGSHRASRAGALPPRAGRADSPQRPSSRRAASVAPVPITVARSSNSSSASRGPTSEGRRVQRPHSIACGRGPDDRAGVVSRDHTRELPADGSRAVPPPVSSSPAIAWRSSPSVTSPRRCAALRPTSTTFPSSPSRLAQPGLDLFPVGVVTHPGRDQEAFVAALSLEVAERVEGPVQLLRGPGHTSGHGLRRCREQPLPGSPRRPSQSRPRAGPAIEGGKFRPGLPSPDGARREGRTAASPGPRGCALRPR